MDYKVTVRLVLRYSTYALSCQWPLPRIEFKIFNSPFFLHGFVFRMTARALATRRYSMDMDIDVSFGSLSLAEGGFLDVCALPLSLAIDVFSRVPVDQRLRCSALCRSWRALLAHAGFYSNLDFSETSGVAVYSDALVCAAVTRAGKRLRVLDIGPSLKLHPSSVLYACAFSASLTDLRLAAGSYTPQSASFLLPAPNLSRLLANRVLYTAHTFSASLTNLRLTAGSHTPLSVSLLLATAPNLSCLVLGNVVSNVEDAVKILTNAAPFGPLRVLSLCVEDAPSGVPWVGRADSRAAATRVADCAQSVVRAARRRRGDGRACDGGHCTAIAFAHTALLRLWRCHRAAADKPCVCRLVSRAAHPGILQPRSHRVLDQRGHWAAVWQGGASVAPLVLGAGLQLPRSAPGRGGRHEVCRHARFRTTRVVTSELGGRLHGGVGVGDGAAAGGRHRRRRWRRIAEHRSQITGCFSPCLVQEWCSTSSAVKMKANVFIRMSLQPGLHQVRKSTSFFHLSSLSFSVGDNVTLGTSALKTLSPVGQ